jgi:hypothetical protein
MEYNTKNGMQKNLMFIFLSVLFVTVSCSDTNDDIKDPIDGEWHVANISGGFAGINDDYAHGAIIWNFDSQTSKLTVANNNTANTLYDGLDSGEYPYSILTKNKVLYLLINGQEFGGITLSQNELSFNQNELSTGSGADGFVVLLEK